MSQAPQAPGHRAVTSTRQVPPQAQGQETTTPAGAPAARPERVAGQPGATGWAGTAVFAAYPLWSILVIALDVVVVYAIAMHGDEVKTTRA